MQWLPGLSKTGEFHHPWYNLATEVWPIRVTWEAQSGHISGREGPANQHFSWSFRVKDISTGSVDRSGFVSLMILDILIMQIISCPLNSCLASSFLIINWLSKKNTLEFGVCVNVNILVCVRAFIYHCLQIYWHSYLHKSFVSYVNVNFLIRGWILKAGSTKIWFLSLEV